MNRHRYFTSELLLIFVLGLALKGSAAIAEEQSLPTPTTAMVPTTPGVALAQNVSELTGVAISPLLGVSAVGAWRYFHVAETERVRLDWYCQPWFWGSAALILCLCLCKDLLGSVLPHWMVKPLHFIELLENKLSAGLAGGTLVPLIAIQLSEAISGNGSGAETSAVLTLGAGGLPFAVLPWEGGGHWIMFLILPVALLVFGIVWISSHALQVLVCMCPVGILATVLKVVKNTVLALLVAVAYWHPMAGLALSLLIIAVACFFASRAMRLTVYGSLMVGDMLLSCFVSGRTSVKQFPAFLCSKQGALPTRTFGHVRSDTEGQAVFESRRFYWGDLRRTVLPKAGLTVGQCLFHPVLLGAQEGQAVLREIVHFLPRWRGQQEAIARELDLPLLAEKSPAKPMTVMEQWAD